MDISLLLGFALVGLVCVFGLYLAAARTIRNLRHNVGEMKKLKEEVDHNLEMARNLHTEAIEAVEHSRKFVDQKSSQVSIANKRISGLECALEQVEVKLMELHGSTNDVKVRRALAELLSLTGVRNQPTNACT